MNTDYTSAIAGVVALIVVLTAMVGFVLMRPSDMATHSSR